MRLWSLHPRYLDAKGLVALWREGLLAQKVLRAKTRGYRHHPQLKRFRAVRSPVATIATYLCAVADEADQRGYRFDRTRIVRHRRAPRLIVTEGQLLYELKHLRAKLRRRDPSCLRALAGCKLPDAHPSFRTVEGQIETWERITRADQRKDRASNPQRPPALPKHAPAPRRYTPRHVARA